MKTARKIHKADTSSIKSTHFGCKPKEYGKTTSLVYGAGQNSCVEKGEVVFVKHKDVPKLAAASRALVVYRGMVLGMVQKFSFTRGGFFQAPT